MSTRDPQNPQSPVMGNDAAVELADLVISWYRGHRNLLSASQQSTVITTITNVLNGTIKV